MRLTTPTARLNYLLQLDNDLLIGGVTLSEWCTLVVQQADLAFLAGAWLPAILTAVAAIEAHLRAEVPSKGDHSLAERIESAALPGALRAELHQLRRYRNQWVHLDSRQDDAALLADAAPWERELEAMAVLSMRALRATLYADQTL